MRGQVIGAKCDVSPGMLVSVIHVLVMPLDVWIDFLRCPIQQSKSPKQDLTHLPEDHGKQLAECDVSPGMLVSIIHELEMLLDVGIDFEVL